MEKDAATAVQLQQLSDSAARLGCDFSVRRNSTLITYLQSTQKNGKLEPGGRWTIMIPSDKVDSDTQVMH
jgi:hypothetical protein